MKGRMSRELLGLLAFTIICLAISPLYKQARVSQSPRMKSIEYKTINETIETYHKKDIVFMSDSFLPMTFAGSELTGYETIKYLRARGHTITVFVKEWKVPEYDGFNIHKYDIHDNFCRSRIINCDIIFFQMGNDAENLAIVQDRTKPIYVFIHMVNSFPWLVQQKVSFPIVVVYNSHMTQDSILSLYDNMRMIPYVETSKFKPIRELTIQKDVVCLINCNMNKGGQLFKDLAYKMPDVQFLGVKGGYSDQIIDKHPPSNLHYIDNQKDIRVVFKQIGILIMASKNETWGRTAVEAMASGVPVIHSESPGLVECLGGAGILCMRDDEDAWVDAIRKLIGDRAYREQMRQRGFKRVKDIEVEQRRGRQELAMKVEAVETKQSDQSD